MSAFEASGFDESWWIAPIETATVSSPSYKKPTLRADMTQRTIAPEPKKTFGLPAGQLKSGLVGLFVGCIAGTSLAAIIAIVAGISDVRSRLLGSVSTATASVSAAIQHADSVYDIAASRLDGEEVAVAQSDTAQTQDLRPAIEAAEPRVTVAVGPIVPPQTWSNDDIIAAETAYETSRQVDFGSLPALPSPRGTVARAIDAAVTVPYRPERVVVQVPQSVAPESRDAALAHLSTGGWSSDLTRASPFAVDETHVRYYHTTDRLSARALADHFDATVRDLTDHRPAPREGLLELWLSSRLRPLSEPTRIATDNVDPARITQQLGQIIQTIVD
ncbi:MAG: hypothetical protein AAF264_00615 [Pseudomonadota bacterium]